MNTYLQIGKALLMRGSSSQLTAKSLQAMSVARPASLQRHLHGRHTAAQQQHIMMSTPLMSSRCLNTSPSKLAAVQFKLADIGEGIAEVAIKEWYVKVGDVVKQFDKICEVQSDKATVTITSRYDGVVSRLYYSVDDTARVGQPLVDIDSDEASDATAAGDAAGHAETISDSLEQTSGATGGSAAGATTSSAAGGGEFRVNKVLATPSVRKMAMENKVNIVNVVGSGKDGRVLKDDIVKYLTQNTSQSSTPPTTPSWSDFGAHRNVPPQVTAAAAAASSSSGAHKPIKLSGADRKEAITGIQKAMVKTMTRANLIPHFSYCDEYNMDNLVDLRGHLKYLGKERGVKISYLPILIKACSVALHRFPQLNAHVDDKCEFVTYKASHNIGVAVDTPSGLVVPNIKNVETKSIFEIATYLNKLQEAAVLGKLTPADMSGGTFTLSNIGSIGGTYMKPVILPPEVVIGALGKIQKLPRVKDSNNIVASNVMVVSWSADHRIVDGATMARFSNTVKSYTENLSHLMIDLI